MQDQLAPTQYSPVHATTHVQVTDTVDAMNRSQVLCVFVMSAGQDLPVIFQRILANATTTALATNSVGMLATIMYVSAVTVSMAHAVPRGLMSKTLLYTFHYIF